MDDSFFLALFPGRHRVLGRKLPAFTPWKLLCLHTIGSPFVATGQTANLADLQLAVKCCLADFPAPPTFRLTLRDTWQRLRHDRDGAFVRTQAAAFVAYLEAFQQRPRFWENEGEVPKLASAPQILSTVAALQRCTNLTHTDSWNRISPGYASWLIATIAEQNGAELRFLWEDDDEEAGEPPDLTKMSEAELEAYIAADIGPEMAHAFMRKRAQHLQKEGA